MNFPTMPNKVLRAMCISGFHMRTVKIIFSLYPFTSISFRDTSNVNGVLSTKHVVEISFI